MRSLMAFMLTITGGCVAGLNLAILYPNPEYDASMTKVVVAGVLAVFGGILSLSLQGGQTDER